MALLLGEQVHAGQPLRELNEEEHPTFLCTHLRAPEFMKRLLVIVRRYLKEPAGP